MASCCEREFSEETDPCKQNLMRLNSTKTEVNEFGTGLFDAFKEDGYIIKRPQSSAARSGFEQIRIVLGRVAR